jgi:hypothetical protein
MLTITEFSGERIKDAFGIIPGSRYEFLLDIEVPDDDELYTESGLYIRVIYAVEESRTGMVKYEIFERQTNRYLEFDLEEDEEAYIEGFCKDHLSDVDE